MGERVRIIGRASRDAEDQTRDASLPTGQISPRTGFGSGFGEHEVVIDDHPALHDEPISNRRFIFFICAIALFMASVDSTIVATALPRIGSSLHARINWLGWTITIYSLGQIIMLPLAGRIGDRIGRKKLFVLCAVVFTVASVACGFATSIYMLVPLRFVQSLGGGGFLPSASGIVADHFGRERDRALGLFASVFPLGGIAGPIFGGLITQYWDWRGVFFVNAPIGIVLITLIVRFIPSTPKMAVARIDLRGIALMALTIVSGMVAITTLGQVGSTPTILQPGDIAETTSAEPASRPPPPQGAKK